MLEPRVPDRDAALRIVVQIWGVAVPLELAHAIASGLSAAESREDGACRVERQGSRLRRHPSPDCQAVVVQGIITRAEVDATLNSLPLGPSHDVRDEWYAWDRAGLHFRVPPVKGYVQIKNRLAVARAREQSHITGIWVGHSCTNWPYQASVAIKPRSVRTPPGVGCSGKD